MDFKQRCAQVLDDLAAQSLKRVLTVQPKPSAQAAWRDFSSNDYLGLSQHPEVIEAGHAMAQQWGAGSTGSRLLSGNLPCFEALEQQVAQFKNAEAALVMSTGYQANAGVLASLLSKNLWGQSPLVFTDRLNHASLHHACQLAGVKQHRFRHNDLQHLDELLSAHADHLAKVIATETVFGMEGDSLAVESLAELALKHQALVYLDEAHATGVWGPQGRGLGAVSSPAIEALKAQGLWVVMGTFSKAVGVAGAYVACSQVLKQTLVNVCTGFVYSTAPSPFTVGAVSKALQLIEGMDTQRQQLKHLASTFRLQAQQRGLNTGLSNTHIVPVILGEASAAMQARQRLLDQQLVCSAVRPPTVPPHTARIRLAFNIHHTESDLERLLCTLCS